MSAPQPWECPRCHTMNAPFAEQCKSCMPTPVNVTATVTITPPTSTSPPARPVDPVPRANGNGNGGPRPKPRPYKMKKHAYAVLLAAQKLLAEYGEPLTLTEIAGYLWKEHGYTSQRSAYSGLYQIMQDHGNVIGAVRVEGELVTFNLRYNQRKAAALRGGDPAPAPSEDEE